MKKNKLLLLIPFILMGLKTSAQTFKNDISNTDYNHFVRTGSGAALYINQVDNTNSILRLSSGTNSPNANVKFTVENNGSIGIGTNITGNLATGSAIAIGDNDTGFKQISDGVLATYTNNVERLRVSSNGNIGIGIEIPTGKLSIMNSGTIGTGNYSNSSIYVTDGSQKMGIDPNQIFSGQDLNLQASTFMKFYTSGTERLKILNNGNVGIGTGNPVSILEVNGDISLSRSHKIKFLEQTNGSDRAYIKSTENTSNSDFNSLIFAVGAGNEVLKIDGRNNNVGIGTMNPENELSVNGTIWAKEVKVSLSEAADWVFDDGYKLKPLAELENYIKENKHLPEIPSAEEFRKEDLKVSEITNKLLQKIEELTLYTIEQQKEINAQNKRRKFLENRLQVLEKIILN